MIIQDAFGNKIHLAEDDSPDGERGRGMIERLGESHAVYMEDMDWYGLEQFFHSLPQDQTEVMISMYLGLKPREIVKVHGLRNIGRFYSMSAKLRDSYQAKKARYLGYN